jgi:hypothetical protein
MVRFHYSSFLDKQIGKATPVLDLSGESRVVENVQFASAGKHLFLLSPDVKSKVIRSDTEYGKTMDELDLKFKRKDHEFPIDVVIPQQKFSNHEIPSDNVYNFHGFGGKSSRTIFSVTYDPRDPVKVVNDSFSQVYADSSAQITAIATSADGYTVTGDAIGCVRLYSDITTKAKMKIATYEKVTENVMLYPKGNPVIGIDIASNREWLVWTTPTFCALVYFSNLGHWDTNLREEKPYAMQLKIHPDDIQRYAIKSINLLPAKFDTVKTSGRVTETFIVSFNGQYKVVWDLRQCYKDYKGDVTISYGRITEVVQNTVLDYVPDFETKDSIVSLGETIKRLKFE